MARFINPFPQYLDASGSPVAGGFLKFFQIGTSSPKNVFNDPLLTLSIGSEVRLSSSGRIPPIFLNGGYDVTLTDKDGNQIDSSAQIGIETNVISFDLWVNTNTYNKPDIVKGSDGLFYQSTTNTNLGNDPTSTSGFWEQFYFHGVWSNTQIYSAGQVVIASDGRSYQSVVGSNSNNDPTLDDGTNWAIVVNSGDLIQSTGLEINKAETSSASITFQNNLITRWELFFDTDESINFRRFDTSGVLQDTPISINPTNGDVTFEDDLSITSAALSQSLIAFQDAGVDRWIIGQGSSNEFRLNRYNSSGIIQGTPWQVVTGSNNVQLNGNIELLNTNQGIDVVSSNGGSINFDFSGADTDNCSIDLFKGTTTTGTRTSNVYKGDGTTTITLAIDATDGSIHPAIDRAGEVEGGVKLGKIVLSQNAPTGGQDGDLWLRY